MKSSWLIITVGCILFSFNVSQAQFSQSTGRFEFSIATDGANGTVNMPSKTLEGAYYLDNEWRQGALYLSSGEVLDQFLIKYDIEHLLIELKSLLDIKVAYALTVDSFKVVDPDLLFPRRYINASFFEFETTTLGFLEYLVEGKISLLSKIELGVQMGYYLPSHDVGNKNDEIIKREKFYLVKEGKAMKAPKSAKNLGPFFRDQKVAIREYVNKHELKLKRKEDLIRLIDYYNTL